jgi:hypothetical protein
MKALTIRIPDDKHARLRQLAKFREISTLPNAAHIPQHFRLGRGEFELTAMDSLA